MTVSECSSDACRATGGMAARALMRAGLLALVTGAVLLVTSVNLAAQHGEEAHGNAGQKVATMPGSYADGVRAIDARLKAIASLIAKKDVEDVHAEAEVIRDVAMSLAQLALKADSGVARESVKDINLAAKALAGKFEAIDEAGDSGNIEATMTVYQEMVGLHATLAKYVSAAYQCPMKCEGDKTYPMPGECPKCGMQLKKLTSDRYMVDVKPAEAIQAGKEVTLLFAIKDPQGKPVTAFETVHEQLMHLLMVSTDLSWYSHQHPEIQPDGTFKLSFTFPAPGDYVLYHDFTPPAVGQQVVQVPINVPGKGAAAVPLKVDLDQPKVVDGYTFVVTTNGPPTTGRESEFVFTVTKDGKPVTNLQPYLGAMGHLVIISQDLKRFVHSHPHEEGEGAGEHSHDEPAHEAEPAVPVKTGPDVHFHANFEAPGLYKGWGQFQHLGKILTVPVVMDVKQGQADARDGGHDQH